MWWAILCGVAGTIGAGLTIAYAGGFFHRGRKSNVKLIPEGYKVAPRWKVGPADETRGPEGKPTLILVRDDGLRVTVGSADTSFIAVLVGALVEKS